MLKFLASATLVAGAFLSAAPAAARDPSVTLIISCYRGPWKDVIWDRPNPAFIDSLMALGYDVVTAEAIANRVCRDPEAVFNHDLMRELTQRLIRQTPVTRRRS